MTYNGGEPPKGPGRFVKPAVIVLALAGLVALVWHFASDTAGVKRASAPQVTTVIPLPPPPPPPKQKPPPEKVKEEVKTPVDKPTVAPKPAEAPKPSDNQPKQMTMNAPAQAGTDSFNIGAGDGSGMVGSGGGGRFGNAGYGQYMSYVLQRAIEQDKGVQEVGGARFAGVLNLWLEPSGRIVKVTIAQSTGDARIDAAVVAAVEALGKVDEPPPPAATYPVHVRLQGRKPA
ncbi:energy transducer TonB [Burkholderia ubonensis subsp. mesacidophila]|uniref:Energy transducer TonB n=2 Tax=Burkholderia ubonensis TaxID=101571 RepID=A0A2A4FIZ0_9BURK|nr:TonB family protein [Burkholderia ubonensis]PCE32630.1 energy transducer TonB [Burkholderia ubonensis subsp. mesacidophila]